MVPEVKKCDVSQCFYNKNMECKALAITIGSDKPICHTFAQGMSRTDKHSGGEVGACHVKQCIFNEQMYCHACDDIVVSMENDMAVCKTYKAF